jgi:isopenicillin-N epimerase
MPEGSASPPEHPGRHFAFDPGITFLNHGSFGACPLPVLAAQQRLRDQLEREPVRFFVREYPALLDAARMDLARYLHADPEELAFVPNATTGVNTVVRSLRFQPGDELLTTDHEYNACRNVLDFVAGQTGAKVIEARVPFPLASPIQVEDAILQRVTPRTRFALIDHVTSQTGLVFPAARLAGALLGRGITVMIDGAHAPGMVPLDLSVLGPVFYTGNAHKWLCAPKGAGFLRVPKERQPGIRPQVISHGANAPLGRKSRFRLEADWTGTHDPTPYLAVPEAIRFMGALEAGGWPALMQRNRNLALLGRRILCDGLGIPEPAPESMIGSLAAVPLPETSLDQAPGPFDTDPLQDRLLNDFQIEVPVIPWPAPGKRLIRISAQIYNRPEHYEKLAAALKKLL